MRSFSLAPKAYVWDFFTIFSLQAIWFFSIYFDDIFLDDFFDVDSFLITFCLAISPLTYGIMCDEGTKLYAWNASLKGYSCNFLYFIFLWNIFCGKKLEWEFFEVETCGWFCDFAGSDVKMERNSEVNDKWTKIGRI